MPSSASVSLDVRGYEHLVAVIRESVLRSLPPEDLAVMLGELTEAWVSMTYDIVRNTA
jgi:hypothetical protein